MQCLVTMITESVWQENRRRRLFRLKCVPDSIYAKTGLFARTFRIRALDVLFIQERILSLTYAVTSCFDKK